jgi:putative alpha-1,2-mannosidase
VLAAFGFLPIAVTETYEIVSPLFDQMTLDMGGGPTLNIVATGADSGKIYVRSATINGAPLSEPRFTHSQIAAGGTLVLEMSDTPGAWEP